MTYIVSMKSTRPERARTAREWHLYTADPAPGLGAAARALNAALRGAIREVKSVRKVVGRRLTEAEVREIAYRTYIVAARPHAATGAADTEPEGEFRYAVLDYADAHGLTMQML